MNNPNIKIVEKNHICSFCDFRTHRKYNLDNHVKNKHSMQSSSAQNTGSIPNNAPPTSINAHPTQLGCGITTNEPTSHCESGPAQVYNLYNQTGSGNSVEEVHKRGVEAIRNWGIALQKENEENKRLKKELHYEKLSKESLPIHMDEKILKKISILRGVKKGDNMGQYPNEMIHCICEAMYNIVHRTDLIAKGLMKYKLKRELLPIKNYLMEISEAKMNMKKKRKILSKPQVGEGVLTAIASFVLPALISLITKK